MLSENEWRVNSNPNNVTNVLLRPVAFCRMIDNMENKTCQHHNDSLYPRSQYRCDQCGTVHGTRACYGAVNWQCPNELWSGTPTSHEPARQTYIGFCCVRCNELVSVDSPEFAALYPRYKAMVSL